MTQHEYEDNIKRLNASLEQLYQMFQLQALTELLKAKDEEIARLKEQLNKNSTNSSKPPSSDSYKSLRQNRPVRRVVNTLADKKGISEVIFLRPMYRKNMNIICLLAVQTVRIQKNVARMAGYAPDVKL